MSEPSWPAAGVECICINPHGWLDLRKTFFGIVNFGPRPGPEFMKQYMISRVGFHEADDEGHRLKLFFAEYPDEHHCACQFRPLEKIEDEVKQATTAPVEYLETVDQ